jgi:tetratricopeptide (TPR) repeat protein
MRPDLHLARLVILPCLLLAGGCASSARGPYNAEGEDQRDIRRAEEVYQQAIAAIAEDPAQAKTLLREALGFDLYHGAAHNNLGVLLLGEGRLYDAAEEFEWARKLLPGHPEPRVNLAITLERGGKHGDAIEAARTALEIRPGHLGAIQTLAWIQIREGLQDKSTAEYLDTIVARAEDPTWREWAGTQRLRLDAISTDALR